MSQQRFLIRVKTLLILLFLSSLTFVKASFFSADTIASYCKEYMKFIELGKSPNQYEAGICSGYITSKVELMDVSGRLCGKEQLNLDALINRYIEYVDDNENAQKQTANYVIVKLLNDHYACVED